MSQNIKASEIKPGMIVEIYGGEEKLPVTKVAVKWGAVQITDSIRWRGLGLDEPLTVTGYFNP